MRWWMTFPMTVVDTVFKALAQAIPERIIAGHHADLLIAHDPRHLAARRRASSSAACGPLGGGWGAKHNEDGMNATVCINDGDTHNSPCRADRGQVSRCSFERYALRQDSGGAGKHRGGLGTEKVVRGARADHRRRAGRPRALRALGPRGRHGRHGQPRRAAHRRQGDMRPARTPSCATSASRPATP